MEFSVTNPDAARWDAFVETEGGHVLQTAAWGELKDDFGWSDAVFALESGGEVKAGALVLTRDLPLSMGTIAYVPRGPVVDWSDEALVTELMGALTDYARSKKAITLKLEPDVEDDRVFVDSLKARGFREAFQTVQPPRTIMIDLDDDETILARMNQGTRRKIRTSAKKEVEIRIGGKDDVSSFTQMMNVTGSRNAFGVHSPAYYERAFDLFVPSGRAALFLASYAGEDLAGIMVFKLGSMAWYIYGASSNSERNRMPTYGLQWSAIQWAREKGCDVYDLWGIPDEDEPFLEAEFKDRHDGLWGVYGFKRGFGGQHFRTASAWDLPLRPLLYNLYEKVYALRNRG